MRKTKIGLLPLYLELYDNKLPQYRKKHEEFKETIAVELTNREIDVVSAPVCRIQNEFKDAIELFDKENVDAIVTLHLAYSPSLESSAILAKTKLPIIILDTTPDYSFAPDKETNKISYNHGIHGVQDMCNLLLRNKKSFQIEAGHWGKSDVINRVAKSANAAKLANFIKNIRIGLIGSPFKGMGDFRVPYDTLKQAIGIEVVQSTPDKISKFVADVSDDELTKEIAEDKKSYITDDLEADVLKESNRLGLAVRKWIESEKLSGFSMNFNEIDCCSELSTIPFLEGSKSMTRGLGYAGEGDVLTAALVATLLSSFPETSFVETFCPGWENDNIMLSHMGEMNLKLTQSTACLIKCQSSCINSTPTIGVGCFKPGEALLVNLAPIADDKFCLILAPVNVQDISTNDNMKKSIRGWIKPQIPLTDFLEKYSKLGGTHHQAMVYNADIDEIKKFGLLMQWDVAVIS